MNELNDLKNVFQANTYPFKLVTQTMNWWKRYQTAESNTDQEKQKTVYLPYVKDTSEQIQQVCNQIGVKVIFKLYGTLQQINASSSEDPQTLANKERRGVQGPLSRLW